MLKLAAVVFLMLAMLFLILGIIISSKRTEIVRTVSVDNNIYDRIEVTENERASDGKAKILGRERGAFIEEPPSDELFTGNVLDTSPSKFLSKNRRNKNRQTDKLNTSVGTEKLNQSKTDQLGLTDPVKTDSLQPARPATSKTDRLGLTNTEQTDRLAFNSQEAEQTGSLAFNEVEQTGRLHVRRQAPEETGRLSNPAPASEETGRLNMRQVDSEETGRLNRPAEDIEKTGRLENKQVFNEETGRLSNPFRETEETSRLATPNQSEETSRLTMPYQMEETERLQTGRSNEKTGRLEFGNNEETSRLQMTGSEETDRLTKTLSENFEKADKRIKEQKLSNYETERPDKHEDHTEAPFEDKTDRLCLTDKEKTDRLILSADRQEEKTGRLSRDFIQEEQIETEPPKPVTPKVERTSKRKRKSSADVLTLEPDTAEDVFTDDDALDQLISFQNDIEIQEEPAQDIEDYYYNIDPLGSMFDED